ncbi:MAG: 50S ribosomal protein L19, partial [Proteobacteria bacterium]|nr:50S ribosomal protein L19 [Pseudomonadota bacterium]
AKLYYMRELFGKAARIKEKKEFEAVVTSDNAAAPAKKEAKPASAKKAAKA